MATLANTSSFPGSSFKQGYEAARTRVPREGASEQGVRPRGELAEHRTFVDGHSMFSLQGGTGHPLVLLHGLLGAAACWKPAAQALVPAARVYAVDALGIGGSARVPGIDASLRASAERLRLFLDQEGVDRIDLCGTSHGGAVALFFAATYPERVRSLILQAPANPFCSKSQPQVKLFTTRMGRWLGRMIPHAPRRLQAVALKRMYGDPTKVQPGSLDLYVRSLLVPGTVDYVLGVLGCWRDDMAELKPLLRKLRGLPCLLLWGSVDRAVSLASGEALRRVLGAQIAILPGLGHLPYEEQPEQFAACVSGFLAALQGVRKGPQSAPAY